jgi:hypothetical protein
MEAACSSEIMAYSQNTTHNSNPEDVYITVKTSNPTSLRPDLFSVGFK